MLLCLIPCNSSDEIAEVCWEITLAWYNRSACCRTVSSSRPGLREMNCNTVRQKMRTDLWKHKQIRRSRGACFSSFSSKDGWPWADSFYLRKKAKESKDQIKEDGTHCCLLVQLRAAQQQVTAPSPPLALPVRAGERSAQEVGGCCSQWRYCQTAWRRASPASLGRHQPGWCSGMGAHRPSSEWAQGSWRLEPRTAGRPSSWEGRGAHWVASCRAPPACLWRWSWRSCPGEYSGRWGWPRAFWGQSERCRRWGSCRSAWRRPQWRFLCGGRMLCPGFAPPITLCASCRSLGSVDSRTPRGKIWRRRSRSFASSGRSSAGWTWRKWTNGGGCWSGEKGERGV